MKTYAAHYNSFNGQWSILYNEGGDLYFTYLDDVGDKETAVTVAAALNLKEKG